MRIFQTSILLLMALLIFQQKAHAYFEENLAIFLAKDTMPLDRREPNLMNERGSFEHGEQSIQEGDTTHVRGGEAPRGVAPPRQDRSDREKKDSVPLSVVPWFSQEQLQNPFVSRSNFLDTTLLDFQHYDFATKNSFLRSTQGNAGNAYRSLIFEPDVSSGNSFQLGQPWGSYIIQHDDLKFYRPKHVFTDLFYVLGSDTEQLFHAKHAQKLNEQFHFSFLVRFINAPGSFSRHTAENANLYFTTDYLSPDKRYQVLGSIMGNRLKNQESKGLVNHTRFEETLGDNDSVFLYSANSRYRDISINLRHFYQTGFYLSPEEGESDERFINLGRINHGFTYNRSAFVFDEGHAPFPFYDFENPSPFEETFDSTLVHRIENIISWENFPSENARFNLPFNFRVFLKYNFTHVKMPIWPEDAVFFDEEENEAIFYHNSHKYGEWVQGVELNTDPDNILSFGGYLNLSIGGYNDEDFKMGGHLNLGRESALQFFNAQMHYSRAEVPYFMNHWKGSYIAWDNSFNKQQVLNLQSSVDLNLIKFTGNYYLMENMVYLNADALPVQNEDIFSFISIGAESDLKWRFLGLRNHVFLQQATTAEFENYPTLSAYHSLYTHFPVFGGALLNHIGIDFYYNTDYYAMSYMPMIRSFYRQDEFLLKDFYRFDVFWSGKIQNARLFLKFQNVLGFLPTESPENFFSFLPLRKNIYSIPHYPYPDALFQFGVSWMFFN